MKYKLSEVVDIIGGGTPKRSKEEYWNGDIPWISIKDFSSSRWIENTVETITDLGLNHSSTKLLNRDDLIISARGTVGLVAQIKKEMAFNQSCYGLKAKKDILLSEYLYYWLKQNITYIKNNVHGSVFDTITRDTFDSLIIEVPEIVYQKKVVSLLSPLDSKIELNNQMIATLEELAATLFKHWFVDFEFPDENGSPYKSSGGKMVDSELGEIPEGWEVNSIFDRCFITGGGTPKTNIFDYWDGKIPFYTPKDAKDFLFVNNTEKHVSLSGITNSSTRLYKSGTIFITARGTVGKINIAAKDMAMNQSCYAITSKNGNQYFIYNVLSRQVKLIKASSNGAVFNAITTRDFKLYKFSIPKKDELINLFEDRVNSFYEKCRNLILENDNLHEMRDSLLPKLLSGDILIK